MRLEQLTHFLALAEELNFRRAAGRLFIASQSLSASIRALERDLGGPLFLRDTRHVELTDRGQALIPRAFALLEDARALMVEIRGMDRPASDELHIGLFATAAAELTLPILDAFRAAYPEVRLVVRPTAWNPAVSLLRGDVDIAVVMPPIPDDRITVVPLFDEPRVAAIPPHHELSGADTVTTHDLHPHRWGERIPSEAREWDARWCLVEERNGEQGHRVRIDLPEDAAGQLMALGNADLLLTLPASNGRFLPSSGAHFVPVTDVPLASTQVALAFLTPTGSAPVAPLVEAFATIAAAVTTRLIGLVPGARLSAV